MKWFASVILNGFSAALGQFSWGLMEAYGYDPKASDASTDEAGKDMRTPEQRETDIALLSCHGHF